MRSFAVPPITGGMVYPQFDTYAELAATFAGTGFTVESLGVGADGAMDLKGLRLGSVTDGRPVILIIAGVHGSEWQSAHHALEFARLLASSSFGLFGALRAAFTFYVVPSGNPYGYENTTHKNFNGVNINRNYNRNWSSGGSTTPEDIDYRGASAASEAETQIIQGRIDTLKPLMAIDVHTTSGTGGIDAGGIYKHWQPLLLDAYNSIALTTGATQQVWNTGLAGTSVAYAGNVTSKSGPKAIPTLVESTTADGETAAMRYAISALYILCAHALMWFKQRRMAA